MGANELIKYISNLSIIDKLKLGISVFSSNYINTSYNKKEIFERMDNQLKKLDSSYIMIFSGIYNKRRRKMHLYPQNSEGICAVSFSTC